MSKINKLSKKIIIYSTSLVLVTTLIFTVISMSTLLMFKKYTISKTESTFKSNADMNLEKEVVFYAKILKKAMDSRKKIVYMFGKILDRNINKPSIYNQEIINIYNEMNQIFDLRDIAILNSDFKVVFKFPKHINIATVPSLLKGVVDTYSKNSKVKYIDFHKNGDESVSYSYVYSGNSSSGKPIFVLFDFKPYGIYSLIKTAQLYPYSQKYLWVMNSRGILIYNPTTKSHPLITFSDNVDLTNPKNGAVLSKIVKDKILRGESGIARYVFRNVDKFVAYTYIKELGWGLGLTLPAEEFYAPIINLSRDIDVKTIHTLSILSIINAIVILISVVVAMAVSKKITYPIEQAVGAIDAIIKGNKIEKLRADGSDELNELAIAVNKLMDFFDKMWTNIDKNKGD